MDDNCTFNHNPKLIIGKQINCIKNYIKAKTCGTKDLSSKCYHQCIKQPSVDPFNLTYNETKKTKTIINGYTQIFGQLR